MAHHERLTFLRDPSIQSSFMNLLRLTVLICCAFTCVQVFSIHYSFEFDDGEARLTVGLGQSFYGGRKEKDSYDLTARYLQAEQRPDEVIQDECECVHCDSDKRCGGLWTGNVVGKEYGDHAFQKITLVVSHCLHDLGWLTNYTKGFDISTILIFSKCGKDVEGAPEDSVVVELPNVGRNDQTYARYMNKIYDKRVKSNEAIVFLKDDLDKSNIKFPGHWRSLQEVLLIAEKEQFACGMEVEHFGSFLMSTYHSTDVLQGFTLSDYDVGLEKYDTEVSSDEEPFRSDFANLGQYQQAMKYSLPAPLTPVCYGGYFATTRGAIQRHPRKLWKSLEDSLSRANNLEEGHYVERSWAGLLTNPIADYQIRALQEYSTETMEHGYNEFLGALIAPRILYNKREAFARVMARWTPLGKWCWGKITSVQGKSYSVLFDDEQMSVGLSDSDVMTEYEASKWLKDLYQDIPRQTEYADDTKDIGDIPSFPLSWVNSVPRPLHDKTEIGQRVMARSPDDGKYYWGSISDAEGDSYIIIFEDGLVAGEVKASDLKTEVEASAWLLHVTSKTNPREAFYPKFFISGHREKKRAPPISDENSDRTTQSLLRKNRP